MAHPLCVCTFVYTLKRDIIGKRKNLKAMCCSAVKGCSASFRVQFLSFHCFWACKSIFWGIISVSEQVYDGKDGAAPLLGTYTGMSMQGLFLTSTSNYLWLEFSSDQETTAAGFQLTYYSKSHFTNQRGGGPYSFSKWVNLPSLQEPNTSYSWI